MSYDLVLYQPEIPGNTGNIIRLCANTGVRLHLVKPLGFDLEDKQMKRAGLDYHEYADLKLHDDWPACVKFFHGKRMFAVTTKASTRYSDVHFKLDDVFVLGPERNHRELAAGAKITFADASRKPQFEFIQYCSGAGV
jgi:tRNA (cytidine/uridine-2'-O-)-methyltransferase